MRISVVIFMTIFLWAFGSTALAKDAMSVNLIGGAIFSRPKIQSRAQPVSSAGKADMSFGLGLYYRASRSVFEIDVLYSERHADLDTAIKESFEAAFIQVPVLFGIAAGNASSLSIGAQASSGFGKIKRSVFGIGTLTPSFGQYGLQDLSIEAIASLKIELFGGKSSGLGLDLRFAQGILDAALGVNDKWYYQDYSALLYYRF